MRGYGETSGVTYGFSHLDDLKAVLDEVATGPVWLVGSSMGGEIAIDAVLAGRRNGWPAWCFWHRR